VEFPYNFRHPEVDGGFFSSSETREKPSFPGKKNSCVNIVSRASLELSSLANAKRKASDASG